MDTEYTFESTNLNSTSAKENTNNYIRIKRKRNKKNEIIRKRKCPDCPKSYQDYRSLLKHRKDKHNYFKKNSKKKDNGLNKFKYKTFFTKEKGKYQNDKNNIDLNFIKEKLEDIFKDYNYQLFFDFIDIRDYSFYELIINNWDKEIPDLEKECLNGDNSVINNPNKVKMTNLDGIFFKYLKEASTKTNINYFYFIIKFVVIFREGINFLKKDFVKEEFKKDKKIHYSQIFNAKSIPETCNDFFNKFLINYNYFYLDKEELIEITKHFCHWLFLNHYSQYDIETIIIED